jgi:hypothetical protein
VLKALNTTDHLMFLMDRVQHGAAMAASGRKQTRDLPLQARKKQSDVADEQEQ